MNTRAHLIAGVVGVVVVLLVGLVVYLASQGEQDTDANEGTTEDTTTPREGESTTYTPTQDGQYPEEDDADSALVEHIQGDSELDAASKESMCATATHVMVGRIRDAQFGREPLLDDAGSATLPQRQHKVRAASPQKGVFDSSNSWTDSAGYTLITVNQLGGNYVKGDPVELFEGDKIMSLDERYLLVLIWNPIEDWFDIELQPAGDEHVVDDADRDARKAAWATACATSPPPSSAEDDPVAEDGPQPEQNQTDPPPDADDPLAPPPTTNEGSEYISI